MNIAPEAVELWIGDAKTGEVHTVPGARLNPMFDDEMQWMPDQKTLLVKLVPDGMGAPPPEPRCRPVPVSRRPKAKKVRAAPTKIATRSATNTTKMFSITTPPRNSLSSMRPPRRSRRWESRQIIQSLAPAPDGRHILVTAIHKPYSYVTTYDRFPQEVEVWDVSDRSHVFAHPIASLPLADRVPIAGVPVGPREFSWRATDPATLVWAEALDGGDWKVKVPARDKIMLLKAPFNSPAVEITRTEQRYDRLLLEREARSRSSQRIR